MWTFDHKVAMSWSWCSSKSECFNESVLPYASNLQYRLESVEQ